MTTYLVDATPVTEYYWRMWSPDGDSYWDPDPPDNVELSSLSDWVLLMKRDQPVLSCYP